MGVFKSLVSALHTAIPMQKTSASMDHLPMLMPSLSLVSVEYCIPGHQIAVSQIKVQVKVLHRERIL